MNKKRFNLRMVAAMVACLAVTTVFASCGKNGGDGGGKGKVLNTAEKALIGTWAASYAQGTVRDVYDWSYLYSAGIGLGYTFKDDGTFTSFLIIEGVTGLAISTKGKWRADESKIYMTDRTFQDSRDRGKTWSAWAQYATPNETMEYYHGVSENGRAFIDKPSDVDDRTARLYKQ